MRMIASVVSILVVATIVLIASLRSARTIVDTQKTEPTGDIATDLMAREEAKMDTPRPVEFFVYFPDEMSANEFAQSARQEGFRAVVQERSPSWMCLCTKTLRIDRDLAASESLLRTIAASHGGNYDGWGEQVN